MKTMMLFIVVLSLSSLIIATVGNVANDGGNDPTGTLSQEVQKLMMEMQALRAILQEQMGMLKLQNDKCCQQTQANFQMLFQQVTSKPTTPTTPATTRTTETPSTTKTTTTKPMTTSTPYVPDCTNEKLEVYYKGSCYKLFGQQNFIPGNQQLAKTLCQRTGAQLVDIETRRENEFLMSYIQGKGLAWDAYILTGGAWDSAQQSFVWGQTGRPFTFTNWEQAGQGSTASDGECLAIKNEKFHPASCKGFKLFICEKRMQ